MAGSTSDLARAEALRCGAAQAPARHDPDPAVGDHRSQRRVATTPRVSSSASHAPTRMPTSCTCTRFADSGCVRGGVHTYVHSKMAVIDDDLLLVGSANCNHRGWEPTASSSSPAFWHVALNEFSTAHKLRMQLAAEHLREPVDILRDPIASRSMWDTAPQRRVCGTHVERPRRSHDAARPRRRPLGPPARRPLLSAAQRLSIT